MTSCIIIDDEKHASDLLEFYLKKISHVVLIKTFNNALEAIPFIENNAVDLVFLDVEMPEISGFSFLKVIKRKLNVIITSAHSKYSLQGFESGVIDYLLKPMSFERLVQALNRASDFVQKLKNEQNEFIVLKTENKFIQVDIKEILYVEGLKNYISLFTHDQKRIISLLNIKSLAEYLPEEKFIRIHKSYIISLEKIHLVNGNQVFLKELDRPIPVSESYRNNFHNYLKNKLVENTK